MNTGVAFVASGSLIPGEGREPGLCTQGLQASACRRLHPALAAVFCRPGLLAPLLSRAIAGAASTLSQLPAERTSSQTFFLAGDQSSLSNSGPERSSQWEWTWVSGSE